MATIFATYGCATSTPIALNQLPVETINIQEKSYEIGLDKEAWVGAPLIRVRQERQMVIRNAVARPSADFFTERIGCIAGNACKFYVPADRYYEVEKAVTFNNKTYYVVNLSRSKVSKLDTTIYSDDGRRILVDKSGNVLQELYLDGHGIMPNGMKTHPLDAKVVLEDIVRSSDFDGINEELLFMGMDKEAISLRHVEKSPGDRGKANRTVADYKVNLVVDRFRFGKYTFQLLGSTADSIKFRVMGD